MIYTTQIEVRRHNGQNAYGEWILSDSDDVPSWVGELAANEIAESDSEEGQVDRGGSVWLWRKSEARLQSHIATVRNAIANGAQVNIHMTERQE